MCDYKAETRTQNSLFPKEVARNTLQDIVEAFRNKANYS
jgi:hypothetical protein